MIFLQYGAAVTDDGSGPIGFRRFLRVGREYPGPRGGLEFAAAFERGLCVKDIATQMAGICLFSRGTTGLLFINR